MCFYKLSRATFSSLQNIGKSMFILSNIFMSTLSKDAAISVRGRKHLNIHSTHQDFCQRFINAIGKDSYIRPHRHTVSNKRELLVALKGSFSLLTFDDHGNFIDNIFFGSEKYVGSSCPNLGLEIPPEVWHTVIAIEENSVLLEVKEGPFISSEAKEFASWAPQEGSDSAAVFLANCRSFISQKKSL